MSGSESLWMICQRGIWASFVPCLWYCPKLADLKVMWNSYGVFVKGWEQSEGAPQPRTDRHLSTERKGSRHPLPAPSTLCFQFCTVFLLSHLSPIIIEFPVFCFPSCQPWIWQETSGDIWIWVRTHPETQLTYHIDSLGLLLSSYYPLYRAILKAQSGFKQILDLKSRSPFLLKGR